MAIPGDYYNPAPYADEVPGVSEDLPATGRTQDYQAFLDYVKSLASQFTSGQEAQDPSMPVISRGVRDVPDEPPSEPSAVRTLGGVPNSGPPLSRRAPPDTYGWAYAPPGHLPGEPAVPIPDMPPGADMPANERFRLPSGVVGYRQTIGEHDRLAQIEQQAQQARAARDQSARDAQMFNQMMQVAKSTKDIEIARKSIDVMGLQHDIQNGIPIHDAIARHPMAFGTGFGANLKATSTTTGEMAPAPEKVQLPGMPAGVKSGRYGERFTFPPASTIQAELDTKGEVLNDPETGKRIGATYRTGPHTQRIVLDQPAKGVPPSVANSIYSAQERGLLKELEDIEIRAALIDPENPKHEYAKSVQDQLKTVRQNRAALLPTASPSAPSPAVSETNAVKMRRFTRDKDGKIVEVKP